MFVSYINIFCIICSSASIYLSGYMVASSKVHRKLDDLMLEYQLLNSELVLKINSIDHPMNEIDKE